VWWKNRIAGKTKKCLYLYGKTVMGNPNVLRALYEELMLINVHCLCQVSSLDRIARGKCIDPAAAKPICSGKVRVVLTHCIGTNFINSYSCCLSDHAM
jgi:hypothetical protein